MARFGRLRPEDVGRLLALVEAEVQAQQVPPPASAWSSVARPEQCPPAGDWQTWLILAGRGWGKTRTGAETIAAWARGGIARRIAIVAQTRADVRDLSMRALRAAAGDDVTYLESKHFAVRWPNGAEALGFSAEEPDSLRGYEFDAAWSDELAAWTYPEAWDQLQFGLRAGLARQIVTTTPRPVRVVRELVDRAGTIVTRGRTLDNQANLSPAAVQALLARYGGTRLGRQELDAEILEDIPGALWQRDQIDSLRLVEAPKLSRIVVAIDPAVTSSDDADETGIVVVGKGVNGHGYLLADLSARSSPDSWARRAVGAYHSWEADRIVAEINQGGDLVETTLRTVDPAIPYRAVHASRGKRTRAEPIAALYEQARIHHVGSFPELEDQLCRALPEGGTGPDDRLDALVWGFTELDLAGSALDVPGAIAFAQNIWPCRCGHRYWWVARRPCPRCGTPAAEDYSEPVAPVQT